MPDWHSTMQQTFEFYIVDPGTWRDVKKLDNVISCTVNRDSTAETLGSASFSITDSVDECYVRIYLVTVQNGLTEKIPIDTFLVQTPSSKFDGKTREMTVDAYTPLLELKEKKPPLGYYLAKRYNIMDYARRIVSENVRAPVGKATCSEKFYSDFVADTDDTWLSFISDAIANAKYLYSLDEMGRILFAPKQETESLQPVWTYNDDNSSILYPEVSIDHDLYGIPNVVEVVYTDNGEYYYSRIVNDDPNSPTSTVNRGREILHRETNPSGIGNPTSRQIDQYAERLLKELSTIEYTVSYSHGYCPVRIGDCVRLNYTRAELNGVKAKVISQSIKCEPGCQVTEKAVFTKKLWR